MKKPSGLALIISESKNPKSSKDDDGKQYSDDDSDSEMSSNAALDELADILEEGVSASNRDDFKMALKAAIRSCM